MMQFGGPESSLVSRSSIWPISERIGQSIRAAMIGGIEMPSQRKKTLAALIGAITT